MNIFILLLVLSSCIIYSLAAFNYPNVRRDESISDNFFGTTVIDAYRWLEDPDSDETQHFVEAQNNVSQPYMRSNPHWNQIKERFTAYYDYPKFGVPAKHGSKYFVSMNSGLQDQSVLYQMENLTSNPAVFLDPNELSPDGTTSLQFTRFSNDGKYCAYGISKGGSDWVQIKIKDVESGNDFNETLTKIKFNNPSWSLDNLGFFYAQYDEYNGTGEGTDPIQPTNQKLFYHYLGTDQSQDIMIAKFPENPLWIIGTPVVTDDGKYLHIFPSEGTSNSTWFYAPLDGNPITGPLTMSNVTAVADAEYYFITSDDDIVYVMTNKDAAKFRLVKVDLKNSAQSNWVNIIREHPKAVLNDVVAVNGDYLAVLYLMDVVNVIEMHSLSTGQYLWDVDTPIGTINSISGKRSGTDLFYRFTSFLEPGIVYHYNFATNPNTIRVFRESKLSGIRTSNFETDQIFFTSKDGKVKVPMFIVHNKNIKYDGNNPTLLYAYGGFNINILPGYDPLAAFFINDLNGVYVLANIRGGGEFGEEWHEGGMLLNKQNVFDDFASAAEYLIAHNYTRRDRLTINGRSNGGLLVGASANQRPDLFGCALANVGVMDMLRFHKFTIGYAWMEEYGNPDVEVHFHNLHGYSPLHNVPANATQYPAMLVLTADHDDRVVPAHSYKYTAQLQHDLGQKLADTPLMIRVDTNSGHGSGKPISKWIEEFTDIVTFVLNSLNIDYNPTPT